MKLFSSKQHKQQQKKNWIIRLEFTAMFALTLEAFNLPNTEQFTLKLTMNNWLFKETAFLVKYVIKTWKKQTKNGSLVYSLLGLII